MGVTVRLLLEGRGAGMWRLRCGGVGGVVGLLERGALVRVLAGRCAEGRLGCPPVELLGRILGIVRVELALGLLRLLRVRERGGHELALMVSRARPAEDGFVGRVALVGPAGAHGPVHGGHDGEDGEDGEDNVGGDEQVVQSGKRRREGRASL